MGEGDINVRLKPNPKKNYFGYIIISIVLLFVIISLTTYLNMNYKVPKPSTSDQPHFDLIDLKDEENFFEIAKNKNLALNVSENSSYAYPGVPNELNEYPIYTTCDGRVMPNTVNPFATYSWAMLAYASMYDATGDERYAQRLRDIEKTLYSYLETQDENGFYEETLIGSSIMYHPLYKSYLLLRGKSVLDEEKFFGIIDDTVNLIMIKQVSDIMLDKEIYSIVQHASMWSAGYSAAAEILVERAESDDKIQGSLDIAEKLNDIAIEISKEPPVKQDGVKCWLLYSQYYLDTAKGRDTKYIEDRLLDGRFIQEVLSTELPAATSFQPCMEVMLDIYESTKNEKLLEKFIEYNELYANDNGESMGDSCNDIPKNTLRNKYYDNQGGLFYLSDNAYQAYLMIQYWSIVGRES